MLDSEVFSNVQMQNSKGSIFEQVANPLSELIKEMVWHSVN